MKKILITYRIVAITMAILIGMTSIGITINMHFCGGALRSVSLIESSGSCCSKSTKACGNFEKSVDTQDKKCCENQSIEVQSDDDLVVDQIQVLSKVDNQDVLVPMTNTSDDSITVGYAAADFEHYRPPLIPKDISVLFETFLL